MYIIQQCTVYSVYLQETIYQPPSILRSPPIIRIRRRPQARRSTGEHQTAHREPKPSERHPTHSTRFWLRPLGISDTFSPIPTRPLPPPLILSRLRAEMPACIEMMQRIPPNKPFPVLRIRSPRTCPGPGKLRRSSLPSREPVPSSSRRAITPLLVEAGRRPMERRPTLA